MTVTVQQKIEQIKQKKYAYQWDIHFKAAKGFNNTSFDAFLIACADIFDRLSAGPPLQRPPYLGRGGKDMYAVDFSLINAWGNGLYFHFYDHGGNPRDGFQANLWCEFLGIADTRLSIERSAAVYYHVQDEKVLTVEPNTSFSVSIATNQPWDWQQTIWHCVRERFEKEGYEDETLGLQLRVKLLNTVQELKEADVFKKLLSISKEKIMDDLNHPAEYDKTYFQLRSDRYIDLIQTINELKDPGRIRTIDISSLELSHIPDELACFPHVKDMYAEYNTIEEFPNIFLRMHTVEKIFLGYNNIRTIPRLIGDLPHLAFLRLTGNPISAEEIRKLKVVLPQCHIETIQ